MNQIADSMSREPLTGMDTGAVELRILRVMIATVVLAVTASLVFAPWRFTSGLVLGGGLSLLNYHWLRTSVAAIFGDDIETHHPRVRVSRYLIRYFVVGFVAIAAYQLQIVSLPATIAGLCSFVPALFAEAGREFYLAIIRREESY